MYLDLKTSQNLRRVKLDMLVRLAKAISMLSVVPNTFYFMFKSKYRWPSLFAVLVFAVLTIRGLKKSPKTANSEGKLIFLA